VQDFLPDDNSLPVLSVGAFLDTVNHALTVAAFPSGVLVEGEVVEYRVSQDKWVWFTLKDEGAVVSCFATVWQLRTPLEDGMRVRAFGRPKIFNKSGKFSLTVERADPVGEGALRRAFELLRRKLEGEGLFSVERKRPIPRFPERIGLIASTESAAYTDFLRVLGTRWGGCEIVVRHVQVQGRDAVSDIVAAFRDFNEGAQDVDVLVLTRGGGSLEDLMAFNSEEVARAVAGSRVPVVVGVGHERDETLADYAADLRASTPTNAAELVAPDRREMQAAVDGAARHMHASLAALLDARRHRVDVAVGRLETHAMRRISRVQQRIADLRRAAAPLLARLDVAGAVVRGAPARLDRALAVMLAERRAKIDASGRLLASLDPRAVLARGYAIVWRGKHAVATAADVVVGDRIRVQLASGTLGATVTSAAPHAPEGAATREGPPPSSPAPHSTLHQEPLL
jgi:exodeoxyribonuclease VII large subunit